MCVRVCVCVCVDVPCFFVFTIAVLSFCCLFALFRVWLVGTTDFDDLYHTIIMVPVLKCVCVKCVCVCVCVLGLTSCYCICAATVIDCLSFSCPVRFRVLFVVVCLFGFRYSSALFSFSFFLPASFMDDSVRRKNEMVHSVGVFFRWFRCWRKFHYQVRILLLHDFKSITEFRTFVLD